ncbi:MAG: hypothetical protein KDJ52_14850, partial [Anaerolineae bacterium]|nr:hypothetical protein [Anaerolineae bacterium]
VDLLSNDLIYRLSNYNPTKNKFYKQYREELNLDTAYKTGIQTVNNAVNDNSGQSLFGLYQSQRTRRVTRTPFASALHAYPEREIEVATVHFWLGNEKLGNVLKDIVKYTENVIREQNGYKYKLRGIELPSDWQQAIESTFAVAPPKREVEIDLSQIEQLKKESEAIRDRLIIDESQANDLKPVQPIFEKEKPEVVVQKVPAEAHAKREITIDFAAAEKLTRDSDEIRKRLTSEDELQEQDFDKAPALTIERPEKTQVGAGYLLRPNGTPDHLLTDLPEIASILGNSETDEAKIARMLMQNNWRASLENIQSIINNQFANVIIDQINEKSFDEIGDALIFEENETWVVVEDYRDEIEYILEHPEYQAVGMAAAPDASAETYPDLEEQWQAFVIQMQPYHWDALAALLSGVDIQTRLDAIAHPLHKTGNLLVDEINEHAQESIGDIIVDTLENPPRILEDEQDNLVDLLNWAADRQLIEV